MNHHGSVRRIYHRAFRQISLLLGLTVALLFAACSGGTYHDPGTSGSSANLVGSVYQGVNPTDIVQQYVTEFHPLWYSYHQFQLAAPNRLQGPNKVTSIYHFVVAINNDTVYAAGMLDLSAQPVILTQPQTSVTYSILLLDPYGNKVSSTLLPQAGVYGFVGPNNTTALPAGITPVNLPYNSVIIIFRADKFTGGQDMTALAEQLRTSTSMETLSDYQNDPSGGATLVLPEILYSVPYKTIVDQLMTNAPMLYLAQLQASVKSSNTPPLTPEQQSLSDAFDQVYANGNLTRDQATAMGASVTAAYNQMVSNYLTNTGPTNWITFPDIANWGTNVLNRASITEYIQYANDATAARYYHAFSDGTGTALDGSRGNGYVLTFPAGQQPQASRFWSLTGYTPEAIELIPNLAQTYLVASYTPGLQTNPDGSVSIYMAVTNPPGVPAANWLPIPRGPFNVMLRVYGPAGSVAAGTYVPPGITTL